MTGGRARSLAPWIALVVVLLAALGYAAASTSGDSSPTARVEQLAREIRCPTCVSQSVAESNSEAAETIRADIVDRVDAGESNEEIKQAYVDRYSEWVLLEPERSGVALVVWLLPLIVVLGAAAGLFVYLVSRRRSTEAEVGADDEALVARGAFGAVGDVNSSLDQPEPTAISLREERDLLLRSLDDLDAERAAGDLDDVTFENLRSDYTARAAELIRRIDELEESADSQVEAAPVGETEHDDETKALDKTSRSRLKRGMVIGLLVIFVAASAAALTSGLGDRGEGQTATGNAQSSGETEPTMPPEVAAELDRLATAAAENPDDFDAQYEYAVFVEPVDPLTALRFYDAAALADPSRPEALASAAWVVVRVAADARDEAERGELLAGAIERLDQAIALDRGYMPSYAYKGFAAYGSGNLGLAIPQFESYLEAVGPDDPLRIPVEDTLGAAIAQREAERDSDPDQ